MLSDGTIKMDATDMIAKYNSILAEITSEENANKIAKLIDFKTVDIDADYTKINIEVVFGCLANATVLPTCTTELGENEGWCVYLGSGINPVTSTFNWRNSFNFLSNNPYPNGIYKDPVILNYSSLVDLEYSIGSFSYYFNLAASYLIYQNPATPTGSTGTIVNPWNDQGYTPYTNISLVNQVEIKDITGCENLIGDGDPSVLNDNTFNDLFWDELIDNYHEMIYTVEDFLPNSQYIEYAPVYGMLRGGRRSYGIGLTVDYLGYIKVNNW